MSKVNDSIFQWLCTLTKKQFLWFYAIVYITCTMVIYFIGLLLFKLRPGPYVDSLVFGFALLNAYPLARDFWQTKIKNEKEMNT